MSVTQKDVGKRVKFITVYDNRTYRYGRLISVNTVNSSVAIEKDRFTQAWHSEDQLVTTSIIEVADVQVTRADVGKRAMWSPPNLTHQVVTILEVRPNSVDEVLSTVKIKFDSGNEHTVWAKHLTLTTQQAPSALPNWQDISSAPKDRPILLCNANTQAEAVCEWFSQRFSWGLDSYFWRKSGTAFNFDGATHWMDLPKMPPKPVPKPVAKTPLQVAEANLLAAYNDTLNVANNTQNLVRKAKQNYINAQNAYFKEVEAQGGKPGNWLIKKGVVTLMISSPFSHWSTEKIAAELMTHTDESYKTAAAERLLWLSQQRHYDRYKQGNK